MEFQTDIKIREYIEVSNLSDKELIQGHKALMECNYNNVLWNDMDDELNHRCEENDLAWPY